MEAQKTVSRRTAWTNLIVCGGISWGVNVWHAWNTPKPDGAGHAIHTTLAGAHISPTLALLYGTAPVVVAAFQSHNIAHSGGGTFKKVLTFLVFALGMALSIYAQAAAVAPIAGEVLKWVFPIMLDLSAFMALHSIMAPVEKASPEASPERPAERLPEASPERLPAPSPRASTQTSPKASPKTSPKTSTAERPKTPRQAPAKPKQTTRERARELLKANPDMNAADLARALGRTPGGTYREMRTELLAEMRDAGELPSVRAIGA